MTMNTSTTPTIMTTTSPSSPILNNSMKRPRRRMIRLVSFMILSFVGCLYITDEDQRQNLLPLNLRSRIRTNNNRQLRFVDPDHMLCGDTPKSHRLAIHCLYGGQKEIEPEYFLLNTVTTRQEFPTDNLDDVERIVRILAYVALSLKRAILVNIPVSVGYLKELVQPYSIVNAGELHKIGVPVVEPLFWSRTAGLRMKNIERKNMTVSSISDLQSLLQHNHTEEELIFDYDELMNNIDLDELGELMGTEGGYDAGEWQYNFTCREGHPEPPPIPDLNDQDNWGIILYDNARQEAVL